MAKKKGKKKTSRRRRVGAMSFNANSPLVKFGSIALGLFFADKINPLVDKLTGTSIDAKLVSGIQVAPGAYYNFIMKGKKSAIVAGVTGLIAGAGIKRGMSSFGIGRLLAGYGAVPVLGNRRVAGYGSVPVLGNVGNGYVASFKAPGVMAGANPNGSGITNTGGGNCMG